MKIPSFATAAATRVAAVARILSCSLLLAVAGTALATTEADRITLAMKAEFDRPGQPLSVDPVNVEGAFAIAGWSQGDSGGRALLQRRGNQWQIVLCAGDALLQSTTLTGAGMAHVAATRLVNHVRAAEAKLPQARREQFARFAGMVQVATPGSLSVSHAWARATPPGVVVGGAYLTIVNGSKQPDTLVSLSSPVAAKAELHRTSVENGLSRMRPAGQIVIAPGQTIKAEPGALHVMLTGLKNPLAAGMRVPLVLNFQQAGEITVQVEIQSISSAGHEGTTGH